MWRVVSATVLVAFFLAAPALGTAQTLEGTAALDWQGDAAEQMVAGIDAFLMGMLASCREEREPYWSRDRASHAAYTDSVAPNRTRLRTLIGAVDDRLPVSMEPAVALPQAAQVAAGAGYGVLPVRWPVFAGVHGEGLLLEPEGAPVAQVVALPDCDWTPEMLVGLAKGIPEHAQFARRLAENGCRVLVPVLIDRRDTFSGHPALRMTNQPHREFIYRGAYEMGRHIIGYEVQQVMAGVDWLSQQAEVPVGVMGYGEGGLIALYAAALDTRVQAAVLSGYFQPREGVWSEPIYRNVWALLHEFGDAEIASLVAPRALIIEAARHPAVSGPPPPRDSRSGAAPGAIATPPFKRVQREVGRARTLAHGLTPTPTIHLIQAPDGLPGQELSLQRLLEGLGVKKPLKSPQSLPEMQGVLADADTRMKRHFDELIEFTQHCMRDSRFVREAFWEEADATSAETWEQSAQEYRDYLWEEVIGRLPEATAPVNPRTRRFCEEASYIGYEVMLDVYPEVFAYGLLLVPKGLKPGERRPVVVCQHGLEGRPRDIADTRVNSAAYHQYGCRLAERGFVVFAPQNPYIGGDAFRVLQRKANPLKQSLFAFIVRQHEQILKWLGGLPFVDPERIGFYGLSYGGKTAMRVPALLDGYCLSICSGDFNEWIWKNVSNRERYSYLFTGEYEMFEFNLGNTFNYAEMSWLILPRPFMVERGHADGVAPDEWVAYEYARTRRRYDALGIGSRTAIEFFNGPHTIHGVGTFQFLHKHLSFPEPPRN